MNLFILDEDPEISASFYCDKHVVKMLVEVSQMLCTNIRILTDITEGIPYKSTHQNHPCTVWMRTSRANFDWSLRHAFALSKEYTVRYGKTHASLSVVEWAAQVFKQMTFPAEHRTPFVIAISAEALCRKNAYWNESEVVASYRLFYIHDKGYFAKWKSGNVPPWFTPSITCPDCGRISYSLDDTQTRYCGFCHKFHNPPS